MCGKAPTYYQERMTRERMKQSPRPNKMLCKNCFDRARRAESARIMALPGVIDTSTMIQQEPISADVTSAIYRKQFGGIELNASDYATYIIQENPEVKKLEHQVDGLHRAVHDYGQSEMDRVWVIWSIP